MLLKPKNERKFNTNGGKRGFDPIADAQRQKEFKRRRAEERAKLDRAIQRDDTDRSTNKSR